MTHPKVRALTNEDRPLIHPISFLPYLLTLQSTAHSKRLREFSESLNLFDRNGSVSSQYSFSLSLHRQGRPARIIGLGGGGT